MASSSSIVSTTFSSRGSNAWLSHEPEKEKRLLSHVSTHEKTSVAMAFPQLHYKQAYCKRDHLAENGTSMLPYATGEWPLQELGLSIPVQTKGTGFVNLARVDIEKRSSCCALVVDVFSKLSKQGSLDGVYGALTLDQDQDQTHITNNVLYCLLQKCIDENDQRAGKLFFYFLVENGLESDTFLGTHVIRMFTSFRNFSDAKQLFSKLQQPNVHTWRAIISAHTKLQLYDQAIDLFHQMQKSNAHINEYIYVAVLEACAFAKALNDGVLLHSHAVCDGFEYHLFVGNTLINMYAQCGNVDIAHVVFNKLPKRDIVSWNSLITGYGQNEHYSQALEVFECLLLQDVELDHATFIAILKVCLSIGDLDKGKLIYSYSIECGYELDSSVSSLAIRLFGTCGMCEDAKGLFDKMPEKDTVAWNALIGCYAQHGYGQAAVELFQLMKREGKDPSDVTYGCILKACSSLAALHFGKVVHEEIVERGLENNVFVGSALIDMYCKCGSLQDAHITFHRLPEQDVVTWSALIAGCSLYGNHELALQHFKTMQQAGLHPNSVTFICLLSAYSHLGLVDEGCLHFKSMREQHGIIPTTEHINSLVDLFGHAGLFKEAEDLLECVPANANLTGWVSLLGSCRTHGKVDIGTRCFDRAVAMDSRNAAGYLLMSNIYAHAGLAEDAQRVEFLRRLANAKKKPGKALIEINNKLHEFNVSDKTHPESHRIDEKLKTLSIQIKEKGHKPRVDLILNPISDEEKEEVLCGHCERVALAFGLISTHPGTTIRIQKNLRMCPDCHSAIKLISEIERREIIITDTYCIHHFSGGTCTCTY